MYKKISKIHLVGIGGIGMSGIAQLLLTHGYTVTGSDLKQGESVKLLEKLGIRIFLGHHESHIEGAELVVHSSAVKDDNPEIAAALKKELLVISRADMLAELMRLKYSIAVAGAHGKTTTTSMMGHVLMVAGFDPTIVVGGRMDNFGGTNARPGRGEFMVVEADESDGTFNKLTPSIAVATNLDREHMDHYQTMANLKKAFISFLNKVPFYGISIFCGDDPYLKLLSHKIFRRKVTYGFGSQNTYRIVEYNPTPLGSTYRIKTGSQYQTLVLQVPGKHNALNATATLAVADELSIPRHQTAEALESFQGVQRRFQFRGVRDGVTMIDDYAHHPAEVSATLAAARERFPSSRIRVVFQPHRYSRFDDLFDQFTLCFQECDAVAITDIYAAGEKPLPGVTSSLLVENLTRDGHPKANYMNTPMAAVQTWLSESSPGDVIITLGAGDISSVYSQLF